VSGTWRAPCFDAPSQLLLLAGREHGRTIPLAEMSRERLHLPNHPQTAVSLLKRSRDRLER
jgi:hypothetical protein